MKKVKQVYAAKVNFPNVNFEYTIGEPGKVETLSTSEEVEKLFRSYAKEKEGFYSVAQELSHGKVVGLPDNCESIVYVLNSDNRFCLVLFAVEEEEIPEREFDWELECLNDMIRQEMDCRYHAKLYMEYGECDSPATEGFMVDEQAMRVLLAHYQERNKGE